MCSWLCPTKLLGCCFSTEPSRHFFTHCSVGKILNLFSRQKHWVSTLKHFAYFFWLVFRQANSSKFVKKLINSWMNLSCCGIFTTSSGEKREHFKKLQTWERTVSVILHHCWLEKEYFFSQFAHSVCYHKPWKLKERFLPLQQTLYFYWIESLLDSYLLVLCFFSSNMHVPSILMFVMFCCLTLLYLDAI